MKGAKSAETNVVAELTAIMGDMTPDRMASTTFTVPGLVMLDLCTVVARYVAPALTGEQEEEVEQLLFARGANEELARAAERGGIH